MEVQLELGHHAVPKTKPGTDFTHFWTLFVRGPDDCKIEEFVDKVVFNLHSTFDKFKRGQSRSLSCISIQSLVQFTESHLSS